LQHDRDAASGGTTSRRSVERNDQRLAFAGFIATFDLAIRKRARSVAMKRRDQSRSAALDTGNRRNEGLGGLDELRHDRPVTPLEAPVNLA
jgi:hypothetical protein